MRLGAIMTGVAASAVVAFCASAVQAQAQSAPGPRPVLTVTEAQAAAAQGSGRRPLRLTERGRWSLNFNLDQPRQRDRAAGDVEANAYYRVTPNVRVGATADLAEPRQDPTRAPNEERRAPRIRLQSIFRF